MNWNWHEMNWNWHEVNWNWHEIGLKSLENIFMNLYKLNYYFWVIL